MFSPFVLDLSGERLLRGTELIPLRPKTWTVLRYLAERPERLITKEELFAELWAGAAVGDDSLTKSIHEIRRALGDDSKNPRFLATVHGRGFRWLVSDGSPASSGLSATIDPRFVESLPSLFVGRALELQQLTRLYARARTGQRQIVFVSGEAGIGKTTLVETFVKGRDPGVAAVYGCAVEQSGAREPYLPFLTAIERLARDPQVEAIVPLLKQFAPTWHAQIPWLADSSAAQPGVDSFDSRPERMLREFCTFIEAVTLKLPVVLVLEDLHWSDPATIELLLKVAQRPEPARLMLIATYRPADAALKTHPLVSATQVLRQRHKCAEVTLTYLTLAEAQSYLDKRLPGYDRPQALARMLHEHTEGNPLFLSGVLDDLIARGWLVDTSPGWALTVPLARADLGVPDDLRQMIAMQLETISLESRVLLETASIAGAQFTAALIAAALDRDPEEVETLCERLARLHRFLRPAGTIEWPPLGPTGSYAFVHSLYRQVVDESIGTTRRQRLHQRLGEVLEAAYGSRVQEVASELAHHFEQSRDTLRQIRYLAATSTRLQRRLALPEAIAMLEHGLNACSTLSEPSLRQSEELRLRAQLGPLLGTLEGYAADSVRQNCERARQLCATVGTREDRFRATYELWYSQCFRADLAATETAVQLSALAAEIGDPQLQLQSEAALGRTALYDGHYADSCRSLNRILKAWEPHPGYVDESVFGPEPLIVASSHYGIGSWFHGYPERADTYIRKATALASRGGRRLTQIATVHHSAYLHHLRRDYEKALDASDQVDAMATDHGMPFWNALAAATRGSALAQLGDSRGIEMIAQAIDRYQATGTRLLTSHLFAYLADAHRAFGQISAGTAAVEAGLQIATTTLDKGYLAELLRIKSLLLASEGEAEQTLLAALDVARAAGALSLELRIALSLGELRRRRADADGARTMIAAIYARFTEGFDTPDLRDARAYLGPATDSHHP